MFYCEGVLQMETLSYWWSAGASSRWRSSSLSSRLKNIESTRCCTLDSYTPSCVSMSDWYTTPQLRMCKATSDKSDRKHISYAWRMSEWRDTLSELTRLEWRPSCFCKSLMIRSTLWRFGHSASSRNCTRIQSRTTACSLCQSTSARVCNADRLCSPCVLALGTCPWRCTTTPVNETASGLASHKLDTPDSSSCTECCTAASRSSISQCSPKSF